MIFLLCLLCVIVIYDYRQYRIPNLCIIIGICMGFVDKTGFCNIGTFLGGILQMLLIMALFWPFYLMKGLGAGDIKLLMMLSLYYTKERYLYIMLSTFLLAAVIAIIKMICYREGRDRLLYLGRWLRKLCVTGAVDPYVAVDSQQKTTIRLSIPACCSVAIWYAISFL